MFPFDVDKLIKFITQSFQANEELIQQIITKFNLIFIEGITTLKKFIIMPFKC